MGLISGTWRGGNLLANSGGPGPKKPPNPNRGGKGLGRSGKGRGSSLPPYLLRATWTADDQSWADGRVLDTPEEGVEIGDMVVRVASGGAASLSSNELLFEPVNDWGSCNVSGTTAVSRAFGVTVIGNQKHIASGPNNVTQAYVGWCHNPDRWSSTEPHLYNWLAGYKIDSGGTQASVAAQWRRVDGVDWKIVSLYEHAPMSTDTEYPCAVVVGGYNSSGVPYQAGDNKADFTYGVSLFVKGGTGAEWGDQWLLVWRDTMQMPATFYPGIGGYDIQAKCNEISVVKPGYVDSILEVDDYSNTITHGSPKFYPDKDAYITWKMAALPTGADSLTPVYRVVDGNNFWYLLIDPSGNTILKRRLNGSDATLSTDNSGSVTSSSTITVVTRGDRHRIYVDGVLKHSETNVTHNTGTGFWASYAGTGSFAEMYYTNLGSNGEHSLLDTYL